MEGLIIDIRAIAFRNIEPVSCCFCRLPKMLLFVANEVFRTSDDAGALNALDRLGDLNTGQDRIRTILLSAPYMVYQK